MDGEPSILSWTYWVRSMWGAVHLGAANLALVLGPIVFLRRKGDGAHRVIGALFAATMLVVNVSALSMYAMTGGFNMFHALTILSLAALVPAVVMVQLYKRTRKSEYLATHAECMAWAYYGVVGAGFAQAISRGAAPEIGSDGAWLIIFAFFAVTWIWMRGAVRRLRVQAHDIGVGRAKENGRIEL